MCTTMTITKTSAHSDNMQLVKLVPGARKTALTVFYCVHCIDSCYCIKM